MFVPSSRKRKREKELERKLKYFLNLVSVTYSTVIDIETVVTG